MTSNSSIRELPPGDPELTANIVSHLKSRGLFDKLRRDCLGDVETKPAYLNLKQRIEGYITKFLSTQTWTPDMNKNHVRDMMRREINESGMLSAGMDHLVDQIVNPKIYQVFTPEVEDGVLQYLGLSSANDTSTHQPAPEAAADTTSQPPPQTPVLPPPPLPPKSEFSIDETTQDVPGSCSPKPYIEAFMPDDFTDSSSEPHLMIVTDNCERTEELPAELQFEDASSADLCDTSAEPLQPIPNEIVGEAPVPEQVDAMEPEPQVICPSVNADGRLPAEDVVVESAVPLDDMKSDFMSERKPIEIDKKDGEKIADLKKKESKCVDKDRKERKLDSGKGRELGSHSSRSESHSKIHMSKKGSDGSRSKPHKSRGDGDLSKESRDLSKEKKRSSSRDKGSSSRGEMSRNKTDVSKDERGKGYSGQSSRSKECDIRSERKRSDDRHRHYSSSQPHDDKKRHSDRHSREEKSRDRSDSHRSHSESRRDKDKSSTKVSSRQDKPSKSSEKHGESSQKDKGHEKERKDHSRQSFSDGRDGGASKKASSEQTTQPMCQSSFQANDSTSCHVDMPGTFIPDRLEMRRNSHDSSQLSFQSASQDSSLGIVEHVTQNALKEGILNSANQSETKSDVQAAEDIAQETLSETYDESSRDALQLVEAKEAEILRFSYVTDKASSNSGIDLQLVDTVTEEPPQDVHSKEPAQLENGDQTSVPGDVALLDVPEQKSPLKGEKHAAVRRKTTTETNSPEKKRPRREDSDGHVSDGALSDVTVSSVHTSDLSSYDDCISVSSADEDDCAIVREKKKIPLREIKKMTSSSNEDDDRMSRSETEPPACDGVMPLPVVPEEVTECEPTPNKELQPPSPEPLQTSNTEKASSCPSTVISGGAPEPKMGLRRTRKINPKYVSEEFSSIFTEGKKPTGTIDFSELAKYGKERHHEEQSSLRAEPRKVFSREGASDHFGTLMSYEETDHLSEASVTDRSRRPARRLSGNEPRPRSESTSSKRYQSSDLYKPRPVIPSRSRRSRPSPPRQCSQSRHSSLNKACPTIKLVRDPKPHGLKLQLHDCTYKEPSQWTKKKSSH
ncbi:hypothetical protein V5799_024455 [Amblyomma americanum]|uniref:BOD1/SHG1 domain-containing protein n=1 Tax=Amblyomma americanum TaxID=6943 RepID=A0AAQ4EC17_AMBAM